MAAPRPLPPTPPGLLDDENPGKWERVKQALWETNLNAPVRAVYNLMNTPYDVLMSDSGDAGQQAVADSFDSAGGITVGGAMIPKPSNALAMGIKAYHGSPHSFDKFEWSPKTRGTGEGAQAYGDGLYFAEDENIAKSYREALRHKGTIDLEGEAHRLGLPLSRNAQIELRRQASVAKNDPMRAAMWLQGASAETRSLPQEKLADLIDRYRKSQSGSMYEVDINADPNTDFINYDAPWSEQPQKVKDAFHYLSKNQPDGSDLARRIEAPIFAQEASDRGVKGIQFLDAGSRYTPANLPDNPIANEARKFIDAAKGDSAKALQMFRDSNPVERFAGPERDEIIKVINAAAKPATRNYVVFDDSLIDIIKKYGIAGLLGAGGMYGMSADEAQAGAR